MPEKDDERIGVIIVDHGSRRQESNMMLLDVVSMFEEQADFEIIEPAHMELAEPSIQTAFDRCVDRGANFIIVHPYFLLPGRHWDEDILELAAQAAARHPRVQSLVTAPLGLHPLMAHIMNERIRHCLAHVRGQREPCELCTGTEKCRVRSSAADP